MVDVVSGSLQTATCSSGCLAWSEGWQVIGAVSYSSYELGELLQWV